MSRGLWKGGDDSGGFLEVLGYEPFCVCGYDNFDNLDQAREATRV
jgi:hypothetical protein